MCISAQKGSLHSASLKSYLTIFKLVVINYVNILVPVFVQVTRPNKALYFVIRVPSPEAVDTIIVTVEDYYSDFLHLKDR